MGPGTLAGAAYVADTLSHRNIGASSRPDYAHVAVEGAVAGMVAYDDKISEYVVISYRTDPACHRCPDWSAGASAYVHAGVKSPPVWVKGVYSVTV